VLRTALLCSGSARGGHFSKDLSGYNIGHVQQFLKKYLQCVLVAKILIVYFVVCTLVVKKIRTGFDMSDGPIPLSGQMPDDRNPLTVFFKVPACYTFRRTLNKIIYL
jgi:hypothetical protein